MSQYCIYASERNWNRFYWLRYFCSIRLSEIATGSALHAAGILHSTMLHLLVPTPTPTITLLVQELTETMLRQQVGIASTVRTEELRLS
jgi:hypothetical protein